MTNSNLMSPQLIEEVIQTGSAFVPDALGVRWIDAIHNDIGRLNWRLQQQDCDPWLQYEDTKIDPHEPYNYINMLRYRLERQVRRLAPRWPSLWAYRANDVTVQHYRSPEDGIDTHQDYSHDRLLVAIFTVRGHGPLDIMTARRHGKLLRSYETCPGSLNLLWAHDLVPSDTDRRPPHRILEPQDGRISITYRYNVGQLLADRP